MSNVFAIIENGKVVNTVVGAPSGANAVNITNLNPQPAIGWEYVNGVFSKPQEIAPVIPTTPVMTHNAFTSRLDFFTEFTPIHTARKTDEQIDAAFTLFYGAKDVDVRDPMTQALIGLLVQKGLLDPSRITALLAEIPITTRGAINQVTGEITK